jgi:uncharacterized membrane protein YGL010W
VKTVQQWLDVYSESHRHPVNKIIHWICIPLIIFSLLGLLWYVPFPMSDGITTVTLNGATVFILAAVLYYFFLTWQLAIGMVFYSLIMYIILDRVDGLSTPLWLISIIIFILAWAGQFVGHYIEGRRPSFFTDIQFLLIGPLWLMAAVYRKLRLPY